MLSVSNYAVRYYTNDFAVMFAVDDEVIFYTRRTTPEKFYIEACEDGSLDVLAIDRLSTDITLTGEQRSVFVHPKK